MRQQTLKELADRAIEAAERTQPHARTPLIGEPPPGWAQAALQTGALVICADCCHFDPRPGERPNSYCRRYDVATWARWPFWCDGYEVRRHHDR